MVNWAIGPFDSDVRALKETAKALLEAIVNLYVAGTPDACTEVDLPEGKPGPRTWRQSRCPVCDTPRQVFAPTDGRPVTAHFCPHCWQLDLVDPSGTEVAHATQTFRKRLSELPQGTRLKSLHIAGKTIPLDPPIVIGAPGSPVGPGKPPTDARPAEPPPATGNEAACPEHGGHPPLRAATPRIRRCSRRRPPGHG